jgi:hypothetical protein
VKSVSQKALMQSMTALKPACVPHSQNESPSRCRRAIGDFCARQAPPIKPTGQKAERAER